MHRFVQAIARTPAATFASGITTAALGTPLFQETMAQHGAYCDVLSSVGIDVMVLEADAQHPDSTFVEDTAVVSGGRAMLTRPGAMSRLGEVPTMRNALSRFFGKLDAIEEPGTVDGGDVCEADDRVYIGLTQRTNYQGADQLLTWFRRHGKAVSIVDMRDLPLLHLKSAMSYVGDGTFVVTESLHSRLDLTDMRIVTPLRDEEYGANCLRVNDVVMLPANHPHLRKTLEQLGFAIRVLDVSEFRKMDGGLSCLSIRF
jgi:dimethylargininase